MVTAMGGVVLLKGVDQSAAFGVGGADLWFALVGLAPAMPGVAVILAASCMRRATAPQSRRTSLVNLPLPARNVAREEAGYHGTVVIGPHPLTRLTR